MDSDTLLALCLSYNGAYEDHPFGEDTTVIKVRATPTSASKMFALLWITPITTRINLKCEPALATQLRRTHPWITPGYHMNKTHWNTLTIRTGEPVDDRLIHDLIEDSYDLVVASLPRRDQRLLSWPPSEENVGK